MKKGSIYSDRKFFIFFCIKLLLIQSIFLWSGIILADKGSGTLVQFSIFYSWLVLPVSFLSYFKSSSDTIYPILIFYFFSIPIIFLLLSIVTLYFIWKEKIEKSKLIRLICCYFVGSIFVIIFSANEPWLFYPHASLSIFVWIKGVIISLLASSILWYIFFRAISYKSKLPDSMSRL